MCPVGIPDAVCRINSCGDCSIEWYNGFTGAPVVCSGEETSLFYKDSLGSFGTENHKFPIFYLFCMNCIFYELVKDYTKLSRGSEISCARENTQHSEGSLKKIHRRYAI